MGQHDGPARWGDTHGRHYGPARMADTVGWHDRPTRMALELAPLAKHGSLFSGRAGPACYSTKSSRPSSSFFKQSHGLKWAARPIGQVYHSPSFCLMPFHLSLSERFTSRHVSAACPSPFMSQNNLFRLSSSSIYFK